MHVGLSAAAIVVSLALSAPRHYVPIARLGRDEAYESIVFGVWFSWGSGFQSCNCGQSPHKQAGRYTYYVIIQVA